MQQRSCADLPCARVCACSLRRDVDVHLRARPGPQLGALLQGAAELALMLSAASSGIMGISVAVVELKRGEFSRQQSAMVLDYGIVHLPG